MAFWLLLWSFDYCIAIENKFCHLQTNLARYKKQSEKANVETDLFKWRNTDDMKNPLDPRAYKYKKPLIYYHIHAFIC